MGRLSVLLLACLGIAIAASAEAAQRVPAPTLVELKEATYSGLGQARTVTLKNGQWEDRARRIRVTFVRDFLVAGDLNADGVAEAAVLIAESGAGTGENIYLALVERSGARLRNVATTLVGDRVQIRNGRTSGNMVVLDVVQAGATDPLCCPGEMVTRAWRRDGSALREEPAIATGRLSLSILAAETWTLRNWDLDTPSDAVPPITLRVQNGGVSGFAGCNTYRAPARSADAAGSLTIGDAVITRMACAAPMMENEGRFLRSLETVTRFQFVAGQLGLAYRTNGRYALMLFDRN